MVGATVYAMYMVDRMVIPESLDSRSLRTWIVARVGHKPYNPTFFFSDKQHIHPKEPFREKLGH